MLFDDLQREEIKKSEKDIDSKNNSNKNKSKIII